jgi:hypothetical protein
MSTNDALRDVDVQTRKQRKRAPGHFHISLNKPQKVETAGQTLFDEEVLRVDHARQACLTLRWRNKNFMLNPD